MLYERHGAAPPADAFEAIRLDTPNCSARLDNLRAAILRAQLPDLDRQIERWNRRYQVVENRLRNSFGIRIVERSLDESYVGSSIQFHVEGFSVDRIPEFIGNCQKRGVELKWFGAESPVAFTSRYDSWRYLGALPELPKTLKALSTTCDMRIPLTFSEEDCRTVAEIIAEEAACHAQSASGE